MIKEPSGIEGGDVSSSAHTPFATDLVGETIGDYMILRRLGQGGMAEVYLAEQLSLKRKVAFKVLKPDLGKNAGYVDRFVREAQAAAALVQSNIVQIYEIGHNNGYHFIAQEYIQGRNLKQYMARFGAVSVPMVVNILRQTAMALQKAAEQGVIHRDIKPENIMLSTSGEVKVTDFGLARILNDTQKLDLSQVGVTMG
ncbi:MAG TPA: serine/threonine-protein kinase, partial [Pirellulaceae bacterium]|nr:serine/threonine-protein kinase [Pirellulaceae bacterium]